MIYFAVILVSGLVSFQGGIAGTEYTTGLEFKSASGIWPLFTKLHTKLIHLAGIVSRVSNMVRVNKNDFDLKEF